MKGQFKKSLHYISSHTFQFPGIGRESSVFMKQWLHSSFLVKYPTFRILFRKSSAFTSALTYHFTLQHYFYMGMQYIFSQNIYIREVLRSRFLGDLKLLWNIFFSASTINSMCAVLCSVIVSEQLKMRKSLAINYWFFT